MLRVVIDTDVLLSAFISPAGASRRLVLDALDGKFALLLSTPLLVEYESVLLPDTISSAWEATVPLRSSCPRPQAADIVLGPAIDAAGKRADFARRVQSADAANWRMRNVTLLPAMALVFRDGRIVEHTRTCFAEEEDWATSRLDSRHGHLARHRGFVGFNRHFRNYFHFLTQVVPAIAGYAQEPGFSNGVLLLADQLPLLRRVLALAGITPPRMLLTDLFTPLDVDDLTFSSLLTAGGWPSPFCLSVFHRLRERAMPAADFSASERIYVWRTDATARPMGNEDALVARLLSRHGVEPVILSTLSLDEQIVLFRNARLVIGPQGAGLANIVFCAPGAVVYELLPDHYLNPCINQLAQLCGVHYWCDVHRSEARPDLWHHKTPWEVDIDAVEARVDAIMATYDLRR